LSKFVIEGNRKLNGEVTISGAKNAALKMLAATILTKEKCTLTNVPRISDIDTMIEILESIGAKIKWLEKNSLEVDPSKISSHQPSANLMKKMRASVVLAGPLLARFNKVEITEPGGCVIGARPVYEHWENLKKMNVEVIQKKEATVLQTKHLTGNKIILSAMSVTGTENIIMAAVLAKGVTDLRMAASEPEIQDLVKMLRKMGAKISGEKTHNIIITGVKKLSGVKHKVLPDRIEIGTFAIAAAVTKGHVIIKNVIIDHLDSLLNRLTCAGVEFEIKKTSSSFSDLEILPSKKLHPIKIDTRPYPGFPTDLQAPMSVLMTQLPKTSKIFETIFDNRLKYMTELKKMGANVNILDSHTAEISGPTKLKGAKITSFDLRAGATLVLAGLIADGKTEISNIETIDRGYERIENKLTNLGAKIERKI